ncbi:uncharacterized protein AB675_9782 [Cyphellophora attinorum]|uniref:Phosphatase SPAC5H10.03 n=1 Tax=Cyphellophora attinorum TaxID=1664694 RepID=A0A0N0NPE8_9EURO|nr:uncharacterized protein AB675_9782 [Phialophora attinorum]KPI42459.1 hypothetical protein AB675_9782 [Phialophora attinorum]
MHVVVMDHQRRQKQPVLHLIRHGQGYHNIPPGNYTLPDPYLTPFGVEQCRQLRQREFPEPLHDSPGLPGIHEFPRRKISLIATSPMTRAIQSAFEIFRPILTDNHTDGRETGDQTNIPPPFIALPDAQESSTDACDIGQDPAVLARTCATNGWPIDLSLVHDGWNDKSTPGSRYSPASKAIFRRARDTRVFLRDAARRLVAEGLTDVQIVLVAHGGFMHYLTGDWEDAGKYRRRDG